MKTIRLFIAAFAACLLTLPLAAQTVSTEQVVDLGLSVKWAGYNIGASSPDQLGDFYAWGEIEPKEEYLNDNSKWYHDGKIEAVVKYCADDFGFEGFRDGKKVLDPEDDIASVKWGGSWRMPTYEEWRELISKCTVTFVTLKEMDGFCFTGPSGKSIFLPNGGVKSKAGYPNGGRIGSYNSSSLFGLYSYGCWGVYFYAGMAKPSLTGLQRACGRPVRAVCK